MGWAAHTAVPGSGIADARPVAAMRAGPETRPARTAQRQRAWSPQNAPSINEETPKMRPVSVRRDDVERWRSRPPRNVWTGVNGILVTSLESVWGG